MNNTKARAKFLNANGYDSEREVAAKLFDIDKEYTVKVGRIGPYHSTLAFEEVDGEYNSVMFDIIFGVVEWKQTYYKGPES